MAYRIHSVAALTGIPATTLRAWERRHHVVSPQRTESGYRVYSDDDLSTLLQVKTLVAQGLKIGEAVFRVQQTDTGPTAKELNAMRAKLLKCLTHFDTAAAAAIAQRLEALPISVVLAQVYAPLMAEIGDQWACGAITVPQEHLATMFVRRRLIGLLATAETRAPERQEVVLFGVPGETHELGLLSVAVYLASLGMRVSYLGLEVPLNDLRAVLQQRKPALVCASIVGTRPADECLRTACAIRRAAPPSTQVVLGGPGIPKEIRGRTDDGVHLVETIEDLLAVVE